MIRVPDLDVKNFREQAQRWAEDYPESHPNGKQMRDILSSLVALDDEGLGFFIVLGMHWAENIKGWRDEKVDLKEVDTEHLLSEIARRISALEDKTEVRSR